ncbi:MAG TPA: polysaccharide biosynthesis tyrosine autokinase [Pyrinomonadaceae bacterium]|jgi:capsular exopolysaccharide synthesis family protein|nr:polysaccharide biosynthesis tyrosine autokinase [Pyrinomonadaceae bacterium]
MKEARELLKPPAEVRSLVPVEVLAPPQPSHPAGYYPEIGLDEELSLRNYWRAVRKRLWLVASVTAVTTALVAVFMAHKPDVYEARARVQVDAERSNPALGATKADVLVFNDPTYFSTQLQILTGDGLLRRVAKTLDLEHNPAFLRPQKTRSTWENLLRMIGFGGKGKGAGGPQVVVAESPLLLAVAPAAAQEDLQEAARLAPYVEALGRGLEAEPVKEARLKVTETHLIDVRFVHPDPRLAAQVANAVADVFVATNLEKKTESNTTTGDFLQKRVAELQAQIRADEERLMAYARGNQILSLDASQNTVVDRLVGLNKQLLEAENGRKMAEAAYGAALTPGAAEALSEGGAKEAADLESKLAELRSKRAQLLVENTEEWPEVKEVTQQIAALERQAADARARAVSTVKTNLETRYREALAREQALRTAFDQQRGETLTQNEAAINYRIISQEIETSKNLLDGLLQRAKENEVALAGTLNNIHVTDHAIPPKVPVAPQRLLNVALAFVLSLSLGVGLALLLERLDNTIHSTEEVERLLQLPTLVAVPSAAGLSRSRRRDLRAARGALQTRDGNGHGDGSGNARPRPELILDAGVQTPLAEAYRHLRTSILLARAGRAVRTILVTSSQPGDGKTTTAINLATSLAQTGAHVLLIDADMRRPRLHAVFDLDNRQGLSAVLAGEQKAFEIISLIGRHQPTGVHVLTAGPMPPNAAELLGSDEMTRLLSFLQSVFTHVVIDSPPVGSFTDGVLLSAMVDGVVMVVHGGKSSRDLVRRSRQVLQDAGAHILGVVLNNVEVRAHEYNYYYHS